MKLGLFVPSRQERSVEIYVSHILRGLAEMRYEIHRFGPRQPVPVEADVIWDPAATGARAPSRAFWTSPVPAVITVHGAAPLALPAREYYGSSRKAFTGRIRHAWRQRAWRRFSRQVEIITVSHFAQREIETHLGLAAHRITPIYHGVDRLTFRVEDVATSEEPFLLHAGLYQPVKNVDRLLQAFRSACFPTPIGLTLICPGFPTSRRSAYPGTKWLPGPIDQQELSSYYRRAFAFLFPSLRESFGLPVLEAMACGCPVVTSRGSACEEVAGDAAILVDPRSVDDIRDAMVRLVADRELREEMRQRGLARTRQFSWETSVRGHAEVFQRAYESGSAR